MLRIRLFGGLEVVGSSGRRVSLPSQSSRSLLAFLALNPERRFCRDQVAGVLWGERTDPAAKKALRNSLWRLRRTLKQNGDSLPVRVDGNDVSLQGDVWVDAREFQEAMLMLRGCGPGRLEALHAETLDRALGLYRGDLLEGMYEDWMLDRREEFRLVYLAALERAFQHHAESGDLQAAITTGWTLLRHNPFLEHIHRQVMLCHCAMGDRALAVRQYRHCEAVLRRELDLEPMEETRDLYLRILRGRVPFSRQSGATRGPAPGTRSAPARGSTFSSL